MTGVCPLCGKLRTVRGSRGSRIADARCGNCGSPLLSAKKAANLLGLPQALDIYYLSEAERAMRFGFIDRVNLGLGPDPTPAQRVR